MKKCICLVLFAIGLVLVPVHAQVRFGVKGGLDIIKLRISEDVLKSDNKTGWFAGPMVEFKIPVIGIGFDAAALYTQNDFTISEERVLYSWCATDPYIENGVWSSSGKLKQKTIQVPINLKVPIGPVYIAAGPQFGYNIGDKKAKDFLGSFRLKDKETSFNVGAGVQLDHIQLGITYNFSIDEIDKEENYGVKKNTWQISAAVLF